MGENVDSEDVRKSSEAIIADLLNDVKCSEKVSISRERRSPN